MNEDTEHKEAASKCGSDQEQLVMRDSTRYPYTYAADYLRMEIGDDYGKGLISRSAAAHAKKLIADAIGMDEEDLAKHLAEKYIEKYGA